MIWNHRLCLLSESTVGSHEGLCVQSSCLISPRRPLCIPTHCCHHAKPAVGSGQRFSLWEELEPTSYLAMERDPITSSSMTFITGWMSKNLGILEQVQAVLHLGLYFSTLSNVSGLPYVYHLPGDSVELAQTLCFLHCQGVEPCSRMGRGPTTLQLCILLQFKL